MRIVASVQAKRGSSRGLVHYIAHSKLDIERESLNVRELFNDFADNLSVTSANNSMRIGIAKGRPSNDELHHIVLSFRPDDYRKFGSTEKQRRRALKETTRAAMQRLEKELSADRLSWAAAVHLNTENPHVHIALQKQYFTRDLERETLTKIPRKALPHFERNEVEKVLVPGFPDRGRHRKDGASRQ
ncbi:MAG: relaxase/mobilization nuclease domain-containing protein [Acidobacteriota bacterium]|nr:MAG: relaxase/mobilization nuclease domain-containing protein [Acidobacteriota bacterium]